MKKEKKTVFCNRCLEPIERRSGKWIGCESQSVICDSWGRRGIDKHTDQLVNWCDSCECELEQQPDGQWAQPSRNLEKGENPVVCKGGGPHILSRDPTDYNNS